MTTELPGQSFAPDILAQPIELADPAAITELVAGANRTVVFFEMSGCPYCVACKSRFADLVQERPDLAFLRVKLDDPRHPLWSLYAIHAVPTVIAFERGAIIARADAILALGLSKKRWEEFRAGL